MLCHDLSMFYEVTSKILTNAISVNYLHMGLGGLQLQKLLKKLTNAVSVNYLRMGLGGLQLQKV